MEGLLKDLRYGIRGLLKRPGFTAIAVLTLALGIGANTTIFSTVDALILHPFSFPNQDRLVVVWEQNRAVGFVRGEVAPGNFVEKLLDRARRGEKLRVVNDQELTPTAAADLAEATLHLLQANATGLFHFTNAGACTWYEFACAALRQAGLSVATVGRTGA